MTNDWLAIVGSERLLRNLGLILIGLTILVCGGIVGCLILVSGVPALDQQEAFHLIGEGIVADSQAAGGLIVFTVLGAFIAFLLLWLATPFGRAAYPARSQRQHGVSVPVSLDRHDSGLSSRKDRFKTDRVASPGAAAVCPV